MSNVKSKAIRWLLLGSKLGGRWGRKAASRALHIGLETQDAFRRGLHGEPEPARRPPRATREQVLQWYANLEVEADAGLAEVERAWKALQRRYHPDLHSADADVARRATDLVQRINEAYAGLRRHLDRPARRA